MMIQRFKSDFNISLEEAMKMAYDRKLRRTFIDKIYITLCKFIYEHVLMMMMKLRTNYMNLLTFSYFVNVSGEKFAQEQ